MNNKFMQKFIEIAGIVGGQRHLLAIRDGFVAIMPLIIVGSLATLINSFPPIGIFDFVSILDGVFGKGNWQEVGGSIWNGTFAILGLLASFSIAYNLAKSYEIDGLASGLISAASYIMLVPITKDRGLTLGWLGAEGLFVAIILGLGLTELFRVLSRSKFTIRMPEGVPEGVAKSFKALIPSIVILVLVGLFQSLINAFANVSIFEIIFIAIQEPLQGFGDTLPAAMLYAFLHQLLWFFGLHGTNILGSIANPIFLPLIEENATAFANGVSAFDVPNIVSQPFFDSFVQMGGSGVTLALLTAIFIVVRKDQKHPYREVAKFSAPAAIFNINEPVIFGLPIVLNPIFIIPFVFIQVILTVVSYFAISSGLVPRPVAIVPWTTPPFLSGYLVTGGSLRGSILQLVNIVLAVFMYLPFVKAGVRSFLSEKK